MVNPDFDSVNPTRRALMRRIGPKDSKPEIAVRRVAHGLGFRFRLHRRDLPGTPDLVFPRLKKVIFVHGCYWHRHPGCSRTTTPKTRVEYWQEKFETNVARDERQISELTELGWEAIVIWECETFDQDALRARIQSALETETKN